MFGTYVKRSALIFIFFIVFAAATWAVEAQSLRAKGEVAGMNVDDQTMLITTEDGFIKIGIDGSTRITRGKQAVNFLDVEVGDSIDVRYEAATSTASTVAIKKPIVEGFITAMSRNFIPVPTVTITPFRGKPFTLMVNGTKILKDNQPAQLNDLEIGDYARAYYEPKTMRATILYSWPAIKSNGPGINILKGFVESLRWTNDIVPRLEMGVRPLNGKITNLIVNKQTIVKLNNGKATIDDIELGDLVQVQFDRVTKVANQILITRPQIQKGTIKGTLVAIQIQGDFVPVYVVTIRQGRKDIPFEIATNAKIERDTIAVDASQLVVGDSVVATYDPSTMTIFRLSAFSNR